MTDFEHGDLVRAVVDSRFNDKTFEGFIGQVVGGQTKMSGGVHVIVSFPAMNDRKYPFEPYELVHLSAVDRLARLTSD